MQECELRVMSSLTLNVDLRVDNVEGLGGVLPNLRKLRLNGSVVRRFMDLGGAFQNLRIIWVSRCSLMELDGIWNLPKLEEVFAAFNSIKRIPLGIGNLRSTKTFREKQGPAGAGPRGQRYQDSGRLTTAL